MCKECLQKLWEWRQKIPCVLDHIALREASFQPGPKDSNDEEHIFLVCQASNQHKVHECCPVEEAALEKKERRRRQQEWRRRHQERRRRQQERRQQQERRRRQQEGRRQQEWRQQQERRRWHQEWRRRQQEWRRRQQGPTCDMCLKAEGKVFILFRLCGHQVCLECLNLLPEGTHFLSCSYCKRNI